MKPSDEKDEGRHTRPFGEWLLEQRAGGLHTELGDRLAELVEAVVEVGKKGSLTLTIEVKPAGRGGVTVIVSDKVVAKVPEGDNLHAFVVPAGYKVEKIDSQLDGPRFADRPKRKTGHPRFTVADGFEHYLQGHRGDGSLTYADPDALTLVCVLNGHEPTVREPQDGGGELLEEGNPGWGDHRATLQLCYTPEWGRWTAKDRQLLEQTAFAEFIEECVDDVHEPPGATMLEIATSFRAKTSVDFKSARRLQDGQTQLTYNETTTANAGAAGSITIPERFTIAIRPFDGSPTYKVGARLRYRMRAGTVALGYLLDGPREVVRNAFDDVCRDVEKASGVHVVFGRP